MQTVGNEGKSRRGFASMAPEKRKEIAQRGGRAAHAKGRAHEFTREEAREAGRKGGLVVSSSRDHMARIGRAGGQARRRRLQQDDSRYGASAIVRVLADLDFPTTKTRLLENVGSRNVEWRPGEVMQLRGAIERLEHEALPSLADVAEEIVRQQGVESRAA